MNLLLYAWTPLWKATRGTGTLVAYKKGELSGWGQGWRGAFHLIPFVFVFCFVF